MTRIERSLVYGHFQRSIQNLLSESHWRGVSLANLIRAELHPYATSTNTTIEGPAVSLTQTASHAVAMVFHELSTNAAKYGAFSQSGGHVSVRWALAEHAPAATLWIEWQETGGPEVVVPARQKAMGPRSSANYWFMGCAAASISCFRPAACAAQSSCRRLPRRWPRDPRKATRCPGRCPLGNDRRAVDPEVSPGSQR